LGVRNNRWLPFLNWGNLRHFDTRNKRTLTTVSAILVLVCPVNIVQCHQLCIRQLSSSRISCITFSMPYQILHLPDCFSSLLLFSNIVSWESEMSTLANAKWYETKLHVYQAWMIVWRQRLNRPGFMVHSKEVQPQQEKEPQHLGVDQLFLDDSRDWSLSRNETADLHCTDHS